jgi:2-polyprenyl-3-methyl-5-hydroxy-6-metoxy-1,4-benzoquinol methylase
MKTNYQGHDNVYKKHKAEGKGGWDPTPEVTKETFANLSKMLEAKYVPKKGKLLELGCGAGNITLWMAEKGYDVYGVDIAPTAISWAQEKAKKQALKADFRVGSVVDLNGYSDNYFDFILDGHCLHCIIDGDRKLFLSNSYRALKPGGFFFVDTMCGEVMNKEMQKQFDPESRCLVSNGIASRYIGLPENIITEIKQAGFNILHSEVSPHKNADDLDSLMVHAIKPT